MKPSARAGSMRGRLTPREGSQIKEEMLRIGDRAKLHDELAFSEIREKELRSKQATPILCNFTLYPMLPLYCRSTRGLVIVCLGAATALCLPLSCRSKTWVT